MKNKIRNLVINFTRNVKFTKIIEKNGIGLLTTTYHEIKKRYILFDNEKENGCFYIFQITDLNHKSDRFSCPRFFFSPYKSLK